MPSPGPLPRGRGGGHASTEATGPGATDLPSSRRPTHARLYGIGSPFLAELARTGNVTASAEAAGVDRTNAQARRKRVPAFAAAWDIALAEYRAGRSFPMGLSAGKDEARAHAGGAKMMRVGAGRWSKAAEERFLIELGTSGKVRRAAAAAGFSRRGDLSAAAQGATVRRSLRHGDRGGEGAGRGLAGRLVGAELRPRRGADAGGRGDAEGERQRGDQDRSVAAGRRGGATRLRTSGGRSGGRKHADPSSTGGRRMRPSMTRRWSGSSGSSSGSASARTPRKPKRGGRAATYIMRGCRRGG